MAFCTRCGEDARDGAVFCTFCGYKLNPMAIRCNYCFFEHAEGDVCPDCGYKKGDAADELFYLYPGTILNGRYTIGHALGAGGFGIVYKAWDGIENKAVAIKEYYPSGLAMRLPGTGLVRLVAEKRRNEFNAGKKRFEAECAATTKLDKLYGNNPSLLHGLATFGENGTLYMVMEYLAGKTLTDKVKPQGLDNPDGVTEALSVDAGLRMINSVLGALRDIHAAGIIHRDISPDNIMLLPDGTVKIFDFGAAKISKKEAGLNAERVMKPGYSPPEQYDLTGQAGIYTDIYAAGATLYFALTGIKPYEATTRKDGGKGDLLASPHGLDNEIPEHISNAILTAMEIDYRLRFKNADEFLKALRGETRVYKRGEKARQLKQRRFIAIAASFIILLVAASLTYMQVRERIPTLPAAEVGFWYVSTGSAGADLPKIAAYERITAGFTEIYPNVTVNLQGFSAAAYEKEVEAALAQGMPILFESGSLGGATLAAAADLSSAAQKLRREVYFLDRYSRIFPQHKQMPTGFTAACVYINTNLSTYEESSTGDLSALLATMPREASKIAVYAGQEKAFAAAFGNVPYVGGAAFFTGEAGALFADTAALEAVQPGLLGIYKLLGIDKPEIPAEFGGYFSVADCGKDDLAVLLRLLEYLLGTSAQNELYIQTKSRLIPLNKAAVELYQRANYDFAEFFVNIGDCVF